MRSRIVLTLSLLAGCWAMAALPAGAAEKPVAATANVFGKLVSYQLPTGFVPAFEDANVRNYIHEAVLQGETVDDWSQMITLTSAKGLAADPARTPVWFANVFGEGYGKNCPETYVATAIQETQVAGRDAFVAYFSCGTVNSSAERRSEAVTVIFFKAGEDFLTLQWAERGAATPRQIPLDADKWKGRMALLFPLTICDHSDVQECNDR